MSARPKCQFTSLEFIGFDAHGEPIIREEKLSKRDILKAWGMRNNFQSGYQFFIDGRAASCKRATWLEAAQDAVRAGYGVWVGPSAIKIDSDQGGEIRRV